MESTEASIKSRWVEHELKKRLKKNEEEFYVWIPPAAVVYYLLQYCCCCLVGLKAANYDVQDCLSFAICILAFIYWDQWIIQKEVVDEYDRVKNMVTVPMSKDVEEDVDEDDDSSEDEEDEDDLSEEEEESEVDWYGENEEDNFKKMYQTLRYCIAYILLCCALVACCGLDVFMFFSIFITMFFCLIQLIIGKRAENEVQIPMDKDCKENTNKSSGEGKNVEEDMQDDSTEDVSEKECSKEEEEEDGSEDDERVEDECENAEETPTKVEVLTPLETECKNLLLEDPDLKDWEVITEVNYGYY